MTAALDLTPLMTAIVDCEALDHIAEVRRNDWRIYSATLIINPTGTASPICDRYADRYTGTLTELAEQTAWLDAADLLFIELAA